MTHDLTLEFKNGTIVNPARGICSTVDLIRTLATFSGVTRFGETARTDRLGEIVGHYDHYLLVLVDGLGLNLRHLFPAGGFFESTLAAELVATFPSTTAAAITSLATGLWPGQHSIVGWTTHFPEFGRVLEPLPFRERGTRINATDLGLTVPDLIDGEPLIGSFFRTSCTIVPKAIAGQPYDVWFNGGTPQFGFRSYRHARRIIRRISRSERGPSYRYLYLPDVDSKSHEFGISSPEVASEIVRVDRLLRQIRDLLPPTWRLVVTADHGLVDVPRERVFIVTDADPLMQHTDGGITGEGRAPIFHVREGDEEAFLAEFAEHEAAGAFSLHKPEALAETELYGPEGISDRAALHLGSFVGISTVPARIEYVPAGGTPLPHIGVHGGLLPGEMNVPLFLA